MRNSRLAVLLGIVVLLLGVFAWRWIASWGTVTVDFRNAPLAKVIPSIERQGRVKIFTNADPATLVSLKMEDAPVYEVMDTLAARIDANLQLAYLAAPDPRQIREVLAAYCSGTNPGGWKVFGGGFGGRGPGGEETDPRLIRWSVSDSGDRSLQSLFDQGAQKTGALFAAPEPWNPILARLPAEGRTKKIAESLAKSAKGTVQEVFLMTVRPQVAGPPPGDDQRNWEVARTVLSPQRTERNPQWAADRAQAQIATLPPEERADARKQLDAMRAFWDSIRDLPPEERRAKIEEEMNKPEVQARMEERMIVRDSRHSPEQRENRMRRYVDRKQRIKQQSQ